MSASLVTMKHSHGSQPLLGKDAEARTYGQAYTEELGSVCVIQQVHEDGIQ